MEDPGSPSDIIRRMGSIAPLTKADATQLHQLLAGVRAAADRMTELAPVFPDEIDPALLSLTVDGDSNVAEGELS